MDLTNDILERLGQPFPDDEIGFLPRGNWEGKARALPYIEARSVMRRLDLVVGPANWSWDYELLSADGKMVKGKLTVCGVTKCDAGEGGAEDEPLKSAVSDALKRSAVLFGIGRYLYYLPAVWAPYDLRKRQFVEQPRIAPTAIEKALAICGVTSTGSSRPAPRPSAPSRPSGQERARGAVTNTERPAASMVGNGGPGKPATTPSMGDLEPEARPRNVGHGDTGRQPEPASDTAAFACSAADCGKPLTRGQHDVSVRAFGQPLCPAHQRDQAQRSAA